MARAFRPSPTGGWVVFESTSRFCPVDWHRLIHFLSFEVSIFCG